MGENGIDVDALIAEIQDRPQLWNSALQDYSNKNIKRTLWEEIVEKFTTEEMEVAEKKELGQKIQKKWKNLRDSYFRELRRQKNVKSGSATPKKCTYIYFEQMSFLNVVAKPAPTSASIDFSSDHPADLNSEQSQDDRVYPAVHNKKRKKIEDPVGMELVNVLKHSVAAREQGQTDNADKSFLLSLLDDFKNIPSTSKTNAKIDLLNVIQKYQPYNAAYRPPVTTNNYHPHVNYNNPPSSFVPEGCTLSAPPPSVSQGYFTRPSSSNSYYGSMLSPNTNSNSSQTSELCDLYD